MPWYVHMSYVGVRLFYGLELSISLCTSSGMRDPSPLIGYVHANTIPAHTNS